jgi:hypothetical protein
MDMASRKFCCLFYDDVINRIRDVVLLPRGGYWIGEERIRYRS